MAHILVHLARGSVSKGNGLLVGRGALGSVCGSTGGSCGLVVENPDNGSSPRIHGKGPVVVISAETLRRVPDNHCWTRTPSRAELDLLIFKNARYIARILIEDRPMYQLESWEELVAHIGPYLKSARPLDAMKSAGFTFTGTLSKAIAKASPARVDRAADARFEQVLQAAPPIELRIGVPASPPISRLLVGNSRLQAVVSFDTLNAIIVELFNAGQIPTHPLTDKVTGTDQTNSVLSPAELARYCTNVPTAASATSGPLALVGPPVLSAGSIPTNVHVSVPIEVPILVNNVQVTTFDAMLDAELPLNVTTLDPTRRLLPPPHLPTKPVGAEPAQLQIFTTVPVQLTLAPTLQSPIQGQSADALLQLSSDVTTQANEAIAAYQLENHNASLVGFTIPDELTPSDFPNTPFWLKPAAAITSPRAVTDGIAVAKASLIVGANMNVDHDPTLIDAVELSSLVAKPTLPNDARIAIDESLANDAIAALLASGDLNAYLNSAKPSGVPQLTIDRASASFQNGMVSLSAHVTAHHLCAGINVGVTVSVTGPPSVSNGTIIIGGTLDVSIDASSMAECLLLSLAVGLLPLLTILLSVPGLIAGALLAESFIPSPTPSFPGTYTFGPLATPTLDPATGALTEGSEKVVAFTAELATVSDGTLTLDGTCEVIPDPNIYLYLKVVDQRGAPVSNAKVSLSELDSPPPAHDDVVPPADSHSMTTVGAIITTDTTTFAASADQALTFPPPGKNSEGYPLATDTSPTDKNGVVVFVIKASKLNRIAGVEKRSTTTLNMHTHQSVTTTQSIDVTEAKPDFGVDITDASGRVLAKRQLVASNVTLVAAGTRVGSWTNPVIVRVSR